MNTTTRRRTIGTGLAVAAVLASPAIRARPHVGLALVLGSDVSKSVSPDRYKRQIEGHISAFRDEEVLACIGRLTEPLALMSFDWAAGQQVRVPWTIIRAPDDLVRFAEHFASVPRPLAEEVGIYTHLAEAIEFARLALTTPTMLAARHVFDISGDGADSERVPLRPEVARDRAVEGGVVINGLPIIAKTSPPQPPEGLETYYRKKVIGGDGAFLVCANGFEDIPRAFKKKLINEMV